MLQFSKDFLRFIGFDVKSVVSVPVDGDADVKDHLEEERRHAEDLELFCRKKMKDCQVPNLKIVSYLKLKLK